MPPAEQPKPVIDSQRALVTAAATDDPVKAERRYGGEAFLILFAAIVVRLSRTELPTAVPTTGKQPTTRAHGQRVSRPSSQKPATTSPTLSLLPKSEQLHERFIRPALEHCRLHAAERSVSSGTSTPGLGNRCDELSERATATSHRCQRAGVEHPQDDLKQRSVQLLEQADFQSLIHHHGHPPQQRGCWYGWWVANSGSRPRVHGVI
jgi:hypothetical protein